MTELIKKLCLCRGVSGSEKDISSLIRAEISPYVDEISEDSLGNLICLKKGNPRGKIMVAAHMDEVGLIITHATDEGYLRFDTVGGVDQRVILGRRVITDSGVAGVCGIRAIHLQQKEERAKSPKISDMFIDIGATSKEEALSLVSIGETATFESSFEQFGDGFIKCKALDNRLGCAIAIEAAKQPVFYDTYFVFTVQEEVGLRGAFGAAFAIKPDFVIAVDTTTAGDLSDVKEHETCTSLSKGAVIALMDKGALYNPIDVKFFVDLAKQNDIPYQHKNVVAGGLDTGATQTSGGGIRSMGIATPCRYLHTPSGVVKLSDAHCVKDLLTAALNSDKI